jgi:hypothetical protein
MQEPFSNTFLGGRNSDLSPNNLPNTQYISAKNVELVGDGNFAALRNIRGTTLVQQLSTSGNFRVLNAIPTKYLINDELVDSITIFSVDGTTFSIHAFAGDTLYSLFSETVPSDYSEVVEAVDAKIFPEGGVDIVYFTDFYKEPRYLTCEIPSPYTPNFLTAYDLSLLRRGANGNITFSVDSGGTLLSGTYQFSYRMADPTNKRFTKWSSLTNPIHVYDKANGNEPVYSSIGLITGRKISLTITPSEEELANFGYLQLAVVENVGVTVATVDGEQVTLPLTASLLDIEEISGSSLSYDYKSNSRVGTIPLEDIVVDLAQIDTVKTLNIKDNRLFGGNVKYTNLEFDNGTPSITSGSIITQASSSIDSFSSDDFASKYRGYWRGEVYRYAVVYRDEHGNAAPPKPLDLSGVTGNAISGGLTDLKFPDRTNGSYTLFNSSGQLQSLGLRLTGLNNHPSWARSLEIVRVNRTGRFKNILFQTPIIPMTTVYGIGVLDEYPVLASYAPGQGSTSEPNATPMTSGYTLIPRNLFWPEHRAIRKISYSEGSGLSRKIAGEASLAVTAEGHDYSMIWPDQSMYQSPYTFTGAEKLNFIDYALLKLSINKENPTKDLTVVSGDDVNTNVCGTFYALSNSQYYYSNGHSKPAINVTTKTVTDAEFFDNLSQPDTVSGKLVGDYPSLQTGGITLGFQPNIQRSAVVKLGGTRVLDATGYQIQFPAATWNAYHSGSPALTTASATLKHEPGGALTNKYINEYDGFIPDSSFINVISIVNVSLGLGDDRYGDSTDLHEYISTGTKYTFSDEEVATLQGGGDVVLGNLDVWGGDCVVSAHTFKVCDSTYSVVNQNKYGGSPQSPEDLISKWRVLFKDLSQSCYLSMPVAVENAAQFIQVVLESEYNGAVLEQDVLEGSSDAIPIMTSEVSTARTPLTYNYNLNLNKQNSQKIYVPEPQFSFKQNEFGARVIYSDLKIYNSDQSGFDVFRVSNFYDIEEKYRPIVKLALAGNNLYSIHEQGIIYLQTGQRQIEQANGGVLAVQSGDVIGGRIIVDSERGCQHLRGVVETGGVVYLPDNRNKNVYVLSGQQLQSITKDNESIFRSFFSTMKDNLVGVYDPVKGEFWIADGTDCHVFNEKGFWVSNYTMNLAGSSFTDQTLFVIGVNGTDTSIYSFYTGDVNQLCGADVESSVTFSINPFPDWSKTFDDSMANASERLSSIDFVVPRESSIGNQTATISLDVEPHEGNYRVKNPRDAVRARLRGLYCLATIKWKNVQSDLKSFSTKYRLSARTPW